MDIIDKHVYYKILLGAYCYSPAMPIIDKEDAIKAANDIYKNRQSYGYEHGPVIIIKVTESVEEIIH